MVNSIFPAVPVVVAVPALMVAVPGAFVPIPFTLIGLAAIALGLGGQVSAGVYQRWSMHMYACCKLRIPG